MLSTNISPKGLFTHAIKALRMYVEKLKSGECELVDIFPVFAVVFVVVSMAFIEVW